MPPMPTLLNSAELVARLNVVRLAERDVEHAVRADSAGARVVVVRFLLDRDQLALRHHLDDRDVPAFVEELGGREVEHPVVLDHDQEAVLGPANPVGHVELRRRRERLDLVGHVTAVAIGDRPHRVLAGADEQHVGGRRHGHVACIRHHRIEVDLESRRQLDALEILADGVGVLAFLRYGRHARVHARHLHLFEVFDVLLLRGCGQRQRKPE